MQQALRDLSAWVERGLAPPAETSYRVEQGQVVVPGGAGERKGIQPVVTLRANDRESASVAMIETPPGGGKIVGVGWDFRAGPAPVAGDDGRYPIKETISPARRVMLTRRFAFDKPGVYFPAVRVHSQREGDTATPYAHRQPGTGQGDCYLESDPLN